MALDSSGYGKNVTESGRYKLWSLGETLDGISVVLCDSISMSWNTSVPSSDDKKKRNAPTSHRVCPAIKANILLFGFTRREKM